MWVQIALFVASLVISYMLQPKPQKSKPAAFEDFDFPTVDDGTPQIVVFGDVWLTDWTVIGVGNYRNQAITSKQTGLFGSSKITTGYKYFMGIHMGVCRAIDDMVEIKISDRTIWTGNISEENSSTLLIDQPEIFGGDKAEGGIVGSLKIMRGASDQPILNELAMMYGTVVQEGYYTFENTDDGYYSNQVKKWIPPVIEASVVPAYRGVVTFFYDGLICSNSPYPKPWSFRVCRTTSGWDGTVWYPEKATIWLNEKKIKAMNAAHILYEAQTNRHWGRGFTASQLDLESYKAVADLLFAEGFGICLAWRRQESLSEFIQQIINQIGAAHFVDRTTGLWKLVLIRDNYDVASLTTYSASTGLLRIEDDNNTANDLVTNLTVVTYRDPITNQDQQIRAENLAAIQKNGAILENKSYVGIPTATLAGRLAARDMKISQSSLKRFKLVLDRRAYFLQPASVFKVSIPDRGIDSIVVRAVRVEHDTINNGEITVTVIQDVFGLPTTNYIQEQPSLYKPIDYSARLPKNSLVSPELNESKVMDLSYYDLCTQFNVNKPIGPYTHYAGLMIKELSEMHMYFNTWVQHKFWVYEYREIWQFVYNDNATMGHFTLTGRLMDDMPFTYDEISVVLDINLKKLAAIRIGSAALLNHEILKIIDIDSATGIVRFGRGCVDSVPAYHAVGSEVWFFEDSWSVGSHGYEKRTDDVNGGVDELNIIAQTFTKYDHTPKILVDLGLLEKKWKLSDDPGEVNGLKQGRISVRSYSRSYAPYPPARVMYNNLVPNTTYLQKTLETMTWRSRNKFMQGGILFDQSQRSTGFEPGAIVQLRLKIYIHDDIISETKAFGQQEAINILAEFPLITLAYKVETRIWSTAAIDSVNSQSAEFEFYGFGVNFGNYFGGVTHV